MDETEDFVAVEDGDEQEPMSDDDSETEETEEERRMQYGFEIEHATMIFDRHKDAVFTSRTSPNGKFIATGGQDDCGFVFDLEGNLIMAFFGHKESVTSVGWNSDSTLVASGDLGGIVKVWNVETKKCVFDCDEGELEFVQFHPQAKNVLMVALSEGNMYLYNIKDGDFKLFAGPTGVPCKSGHFTTGGRQYLMAYEDGSLRWFDLKSTNMISTIQCKLNEAICMQPCPDESFCLVGSAEGQVETVSMKNGTLKSVGQIKMEEKEETHHPVEAIDFHPSGDMFAIASLSGFAYVYEKQRLRLKLLHPDGVNGVKFCPGNKPRIITSCLDGKLKIWDCRNGDELITLHGHAEAILDLALENYACTTSSDDHTVRYWDLAELEERAQSQAK